MYNIRHQIGLYVQVLPLIVCLSEFSVNMSLVFHIGTGL